MRLLTFLILVCGVLAADRPAEEAKKELARLQGTWKVVAVEKDGKRLSAEQTEDWKLIIKNSKYRFLQGKEKLEGNYRIDPGQAPKTIDATRTSGADKGKTLRGIYVLRGHRLMICLAAPGKAKRPASLITQSGAGLTLYVLERARR